MQNQEYKTLKQIVSKEDRINIIRLLDKKIENKDNYFSNIIYLRKKLSYESKQKIYQYCKEKLNYNDTLETLFKPYERLPRRKDNSVKSVFAKRVTIAIAKEKYFHNRTLEKIVNDSENTDYYFSIATLNNYKSGKSEPNHANIDKLAKCLNVIPQYLKEEDKYLNDLSFLPLDFEKKEYLDNILYNLNIDNKQKNFISDFKSYLRRFHKDFNYPLENEYNDFIEDLDANFLLSDLLYQIENHFFETQSIDMSKQLSHDTPMYSIGGINSEFKQDIDPIVNKLKHNFYEYQLEYWIVDNNYETYEFYDNFHTFKTKKEYLEYLIKRIQRIKDEIKDEENHLEDIQKKIDNGEIETVIFENEEEIENYFKTNK